MQMWLLWNAAVKSLVVAFRGTEQVKWKDMMTDLSFQPAPFNPERVLERSSSASLIRQEVRSPVGMAHQPATPSFAWTILAEARLMAVQAV